MLILIKTLKQYLRKNLVNFMKIKKAILPVAGLGTRFLPATKAQPKEMLPVVDKPVIQYLVEEAVASGIKEIIFITGRGKRAIEDHFDISYELEYTLAKKNKHELLGRVDKISTLARFTYVRQPVPLGDGHAILQASHLVKDEPVLVMYGDCIYDSSIPAAKQLIDVFEKYGDSVIGLSRVKKENISKFGVVEGVKLDEKNLEIKNIIEKPDPDKAPSDLVAVGKYIITPEVFDTLSEMSQKKSEEIGLSHAFKIMLSNKRPIYGHLLEGDWLDTGDKFGFIKASIQLGLKHPEIKDKLEQYLKSLKNK